MRNELMLLLAGPVAAAAAAAVASDDWQEEGRELKLSESNELMLNCSCGLIQQALHAHTRNGRSIHRVGVFWMVCVCCVLFNFVVIIKTFSFDIIVNKPHFIYSFMCFICKYTCIISHTLMHTMAAGLFIFFLKRKKNCVR